ncbi:MAG: nitrogenase cofactor biosynthesis protein NifB [Spirochaetes bacterium]|nr:nitrogenase cofactor biosynthesis protein NifB [Spirochaetota bacterium]
MNIKLDQHPCFNDKVRHKFGRIHLPVAPRCNIQCNFCDRRFDCVNESRPGVSSGILSPLQSLEYLKEIITDHKNISVVGIAGPGDPFANEKETLETLRLIRNTFPEMLLCLASNGLQVLPHVDELKKLDVSHVTITLNAIDPAIGSKIYSWVRYGKKVYGPEEGAAILLENQLASIEALKKAGIIVKINSIIIPGINDHHIPLVAEKVASMGADILNCLPLYSNKESVFSDIPEPEKEMTARIRKESEKFMPQMHHCTRCRADAVGLLHEGTSDSIMKKIEKHSKINNVYKLVPDNTGNGKNYIAVASREGLLINQHLGETVSFHIFRNTPEGIELVETREAPSAGSSERWEKLSEILADCRAVLVNGIGNNPKTVLEKNGIAVLVIEGLISEAAAAVFEGRNTNHLLKRKETACGEECTGTAMGCS